MKRSDGELLSGLGRAVKTSGEQGARRAAGRDAEERSLFLERAQRRASEKPSSRRSWALAFAACVGLLALALFVVTRSGVAPLGYEVHGSPAASGGFVQAAPDAEAQVRFTDGSEVRLAAGARARVLGVTERGAELSIESGVVSVSIVPRAGGADYVLKAGPYAVSVTGTRFELEWSPAEQRLSIALEEGSVSVAGPSHDPIAMRAGQQISLSPSGVELREAEATLSAPRPAPLASDVSAAQPSSAPATPSVVSAPPARSSSSSSSSSWAERVATGDFDGVLDEADARGIDAVLGGASATELMALADAARYGGRASLATQALKSVRSRFAGTRSASTAAFLLGRLAEDGGRADAAIALYDATLAEGGSFAGEALGRKMLLIKRRSGAVAARSVAEQYLARFPKGAFAAQAKAILAQ